MYEDGQIFPFIIKMGSILKNLQENKKSYHVSTTSMWHDLYPCQSGVMSLRHDFSFEKEVVSIYHDFEYEFV